MAFLAANGILTVEDLCARNARKLLDIPRLGLGTLARIETALHDHHAELSDDPWGPYGCARYQPPTDDSSLTGSAIRCRQGGQKRDEVRL